MWVEDFADGMMVPLCLHWYSRGPVPEAEHLSVVVVPSCTVFNLSLESVMCTFDGTAVEGVGMRSIDYQLMANKKIRIQMNYIYLNCRIIYSYRQKHLQQL